MSDLRAALRHHTLRTGIVEFDNGSGSIVRSEKRVRDRSSGPRQIGAHVRSGCPGIL